ncbi:MAG: uroporphyrinogen-III C-methyltransferase [Armatimonadetes bacterium]|nr:uroporphyrinogen-III C-methyltransferase [Armatimonadota bacterium]
MSTIGTVYLVGAGPGDPGLLTVRGKAILERADAVVYDRLANPAFLDLARPDAERVFVGKGPGRHVATQEEINACIVELALAGKSVCRLKGGDPFVFGRGGEEALECLAHGIAFEVVPGVTSAIAAAAYAGIPVTHRAVATSFAVITGHEDPDKPETQVDWTRLSAAADTLVFLMGIGNLETITAQLIGHGRAPDTPVAVVRRGTWPEQQTVVGTLADICAKVAESGLKPPAATIVGEVVRLREQLSWFETRPLHGRTVVVTRSRTQASELGEALAELGAEVVEFPVIAIRARDVAVRVRELVEARMPVDWLVFTSTNAVELFFAAVGEAGADARVLGGCRLGAVGSATAAALAERGLRADFVPSSFSAADFVREFPDSQAGKVLLPCASAAAETIPQALGEHGVAVEVLPLYDTVLDQGDVAAVRERFAAGEIDAVTFTSSSTVENFHELLPDISLEGVCLAAIGPRTAETMARLGLPATVTAEESTIAGLAKAVCAALGG